MNLRKDGVKSFLMPMWWAAGLTLIFFLSGYAAWGELPWVELQRSTAMLSGVGIAYLASIVIVYQLDRSDIGRLHLGVVLATVVGAFAVLALILLFSRAYYSRTFILLAMGFAMFWLKVGQWLSHRLFLPRLAVMPAAVRPEVLHARDAEWVPLARPELPDEALSGLVANRDSKDEEWQRLYIKCKMKGIPIYHGATVSEQVTGRMSLERLSEGHILDRTVPIGYAFFKRVTDLVVPLCLAPAFLPLILLTGIVIKLDSPGPMFFCQPRVGLGGQQFRMIKLRSMHVDAEKDGARFAHQADHRVTRVGRLIRRLRIDELPQFWNVLKGEMSIIGPRPEQVEFVMRLQTSIPFYGYRHVVRPGIAGWAQTLQGYADSETAAQAKLEYDLYYVKNCSLWLDLLIVFRTFHTIFTGHGAR